jgi:preprotein translocase subunit SecE
MLSSHEAVLKNQKYSFWLILGKFMKIVESVKNYLFGSYVEMTKVTWPTKQQTINYSLLVVGLSVGTALFFVVLDFVFNYGIEQIITR